jgi:hypothetical protein
MMQDKPAKFVAGDGPKKAAKADKQDLLHTYSYSSA